jgi:hypothetical protein
VCWLVADWVVAQIVDCVSTAQRWLEEGCAGCGSDLALALFNLMQRLCAADGLVTMG